MNSADSGTEAQAFDIESLVREHGDVLYRFALTRVSNPQQAEDLVQDTFLAALKSIDRFRGESHIRTYLIGILKNKVYDHYKRASREESYEAVDASGDEPYFNAAGRWKSEFFPRNWGVDDGDPAELYERREFLEILRACLQGLAPRAARVFVLREVERVTGKDVCEMLELSESNVGVILHRARLQLQQCIGSQWAVGGGR